MPRVLVPLVFSVMTAGPVAAQAPYNLTAPVHSLATIFTDLYGPSGLVVDSLATLPGEQPHTAHFNSDFQFDFSQFGTALVSQLVSVPSPSPAGGFTYEFDPTLGVFQRTTRSFGPIHTDRAETVGARRVSIGFAFQRFTFDTIEDLDLGAIPAVFTHDNAALRGGREDVVTTLTAIDATVNQASAFVTVGVTDRFDVSLAVPYLWTSMDVVSTATIHRLGTTNELTHFFRQSNGDVGDTRVFTARGDASGIGDLRFRVKANVARRPAGAVSMGADIWLPTGDEMNLLGSGAAAIEPFAIWSATYQGVSPHVNVSYTWYGSSVLAGNPGTGEAAPFPDRFSYAAGADIAVHPRVTVALDLLGRYVVDAERLTSETFQALDGRSTFPNITFAHDSFNMINGTAGLKVGLADRLLVEASLMFSLDRHGLRDKISPLVGLEYAF